MAQPPRRREPGDSAADDHHVASHAGIIGARRSPQVGLPAWCSPKAELLSLQQIRCFCAALELGSFTAAADALRVSQPAVAEQIRKLEQALGTDLFVRAGRGVVPTEAGRAFAEHATRSLRALEDAAGSVGELTSLQTGTVASASSAARRPGASTSSWPRSCAAHPNVVGAARRPQLVGDRRARPRAASSRPGSCCCRSTTTGSTCARSCATRCSTSAPIRERTREPATIERLAATPLVFYDAESADDDPIRRQLAERAQALGRAAAAARRGRAQGHRAAARRRRHRRHLPAERLHPRAVLPRRPAARRSFSPRSTTRSRSSPAPARGSPRASASCSAALEAHMRAVADEFDRSRA